MIIQYDYYYEIQVFSSVATHTKRGFILFSSDPFFMHALDINCFAAKQLFTLHDSITK